MGFGFILAIIFGIGGLVSLGSLIYTAIFYRNIDLNHTQILTAACFLGALFCIGCELNLLS